MDEAGLELLVDDAGPGVLRLRKFLIEMCLVGTHPALLPLELAAICQLTVREDVLSSGHVTGAARQERHAGRFLHSTGETACLDIGALWPVNLSQARLEGIDFLDDLVSVDR